MSWGRAKLLDPNILAGARWAAARDKEAKFDDLVREAAEADMLEQIERLERVKDRLRAELHDVAEALEEAVAYARSREVTFCEHNTSDRQFAATAGRWADPDGWDLSICPKCPHMGRCMREAWQWCSHCMGCSK